LIGGRSDASIAAPIPIPISLIQLLGSATAIGLIVGIVGYYQARMHNQPTLKLSFRHSLIDASLMILILLGLIGSNLGLRWLDPVLAGVIVLIAVIIGWQVLNRQLPSLMQQVAIAPEALTATVCQVEGILHCYAIQSRGLVGRLVYIEMRLILHPECMTVASTIVARVERVIRQQFGPVKVVLYVESNPLTRDSRSS
jgi:divalent metal cation (Fe/Co/Zn/Cd) transporter